MQQGLIVGAVVISYFIISTLFFSAPTFHGSDDFLYDEDDYDSHRRGRGGFGGGGHYGLSWTMWMAVMGAAYVLILIVLCHGYLSVPINVMVHISYRVVH